MLEVQLLLFERDSIITQVVLIDMVIADGVTGRTIA